MTRQKLATWFGRTTWTPGLIIIAAALLFSFGWWHALPTALRWVPTAPTVLFMLGGGFAVAILMSKLPNKAKARWLRYEAHFAALSVAGMVFWDWWNWRHLNSEWFRDTTFYTGRAGITFLFLSLACTPLVTLFDWKALNQLRKPLGNWGFGFVALHLFMFAMDYGMIDGAFRLMPVVDEAILKGYAVIGFIAFLLLIPLFATSNKWSQKQLGKRWKRLHQLVYLINVLAVGHYIWVWSSKRAFTAPLTYAVILAFLLFIRIKPIKQQIVRWRRAVARPRPAAR